ncbi:MAG TPA: DUF2336 domain-containing protein [Rhizomicrobium sp.]
MAFAAAKSDSHISASAALREGEPRQDLYLAVATLFHRQAPALSQRERALMRDILRRLASDVEMSIRIALAERLADDPNAPLELILLLVDDRVEVARPIILRSRQLGDAELLDLIARTDDGMRAVLAERPHIAASITSVLANSDAEPVLVALARNVTASFDDATFAVLVEKSRGIAALHEPLATRSDLPVALALRMCAWVSEALKTYLVRTYRFDPDVADELVTQASQIVDEERHGSTGAAKLIAKLAAADQLRPGFLVRVLRQGQYELFDLGFARLLDLELEVFRDLFYARSAGCVALACRAGGIDRSVFATVLELVAKFRNRPSAAGPDERISVDRAFALTRADAYARIRAIPFT